MSGVLANSGSIKRYEQIVSTQINGGILKDRSQKNIRNFFMKINIDDLKKVYADTHDSMYAEPEFVGKYLDTAIQLYLNNGNEEILNRAKELVFSIIGNQREDGYLGTYHPGLEFDYTFSVWNQNFTIMGLLSYYDVTKENVVLDAVMRCADYIASNFMSKNGPDLLNTINQGIENSCILLQMVRLYRITGKKLYKDFCDFIIQKWEATTLKLVSTPKFSHLGCAKAAEMLICYQGLVEYGSHHGNQNYLNSAARYWDNLNDTQIGLTGNGSIAEFWNYVGNKPALLNNDIKPNENCVAVCWMKFCIALFSLDAETKYMDAFEKTLFNHLLGSQALDGSDFSYYQGAYGRKLHETSPDQYKCCCYRGMNILSHLPKCIYWKSKEGFVVALYCDSELHSEYKGIKVKFLQETAYPREGKILINVQPELDLKFMLKLRIPSWCTKAHVTINGNVLPVKNDSGYICIEKIWNALGDMLELSLDMPIKCINAVVDETESVAVTYGPILLAIDSRYGTPIDLTEIELKDDGVELKPVLMGDSSYSPLVKFMCSGRIDGKLKEITLVDYATAGSIDNIKDHFRIWLPRLK